MSDGCTRFRWGLLALLLTACTTPSPGTETGGGSTGGGDSDDGNSDAPTAPTDPDPGTSDGDDTATTSGDPTTGGADDESTGDPPPPPPPAGCEGPSLFEPGTHTDITIDVGGTSRSYDLFVPASYDPTTLGPLVLNFHGLLGTPSQQAGFSQFNMSAENHSMLVAYPAGIGNSFNAGACCGTASSTGVDDVGFARAIVQDVSVKMCVDPKRVHVTGMSNGGHMAHRLACEASDVFASAASVTGVLSLVGPCTPTRPISMVQYHGTADTIVGYDGFPSVVPMMEAWAARNGCGTVPEITFQEGDTTCETWPGCDAGVEVTLCTVEGGGHCWPGNSSCIFGSSTTALHASDEIAQMFDEQPLP